MATGNEMDQLSSGQWSLIGSALYLLICAGFGAYASLQKGRPWFEGLAFGLFLGPIGVVAAACLPDVRGLRDKHVINWVRGGPDQVDDDDDVRVRESLARMQPNTREVRNTRADFPNLDL